MPTFYSTIFFSYGATFSYGLGSRTKSPSGFLKIHFRMGYYIFYPFFESSIGISPGFLHQAGWGICFVPHAEAPLSPTPVKPSRRMYRFHAFALFVFVSEIFSLLCNTGSFWANCSPYFTDEFPERILVLHPRPVLKKL